MFDSTQGAVLTTDASALASNLGADYRCACILCCAQILTAATVSSKLGLEHDELDTYEPNSSLAANVNSFLATEEESSDIILLQVRTQFSEITQVHCAYEDAECNCQVADCPTNLLA